MKHGSRGHRLWRTAVAINALRQDGASASRPSCRIRAKWKFWNGLGHSVSRFSYFSSEQMIREQISSVLRFGSLKVATMCRKTALLPDGVERWRCSIKRSQQLITLWCSTTARPLRLSSVHASSFAAAGRRTESRFGSSHRYPIGSVTMFSLRCELLPPIRRNDVTIAAVGCGGGDPAVRWQWSLRRRAPASEEGSPQQLALPFGLASPPSTETPDPIQSIFIHIIFR
jgi:hypothetical protein